MTDRPPAAWELEQEARAVNATAWEPPPGREPRAALPGLRKGRQPAADQDAPQFTMIAADELIAESAKENGFPMTRRAGP